MITALEHRVILDVDVGVDDAMALFVFFYAMKLSLVKIEAIICTNGNTNQTNVINNLVRLLELTGKTKIPVYRGAANSFIPLLIPEFPYQGVDGFGDLTYDHEPDLSIVNNTLGVSAIYNLVKNNPNQISLIALGPLSTVAVTHRLYDDFLENVKDIWVMGGNYQGIGNTRGTGEFNFFIDPEAAFIVLNNGIKKVNLLPWEACAATPLTPTWRFDVLGKSTLPEMELLTKAERNVHKMTEKAWICCDAQVAAAYLFPQSVIKTQAYNASVELHGSITRGQVTINPEATTFNVNMLTTLDFEYFANLLRTVAKVN